MPSPIVMVHGAFCGGWVFDRFRTLFERAGHLVTAPDLPGHEAGAGRGGVIGKSMADYAASVAALCAAQGAPPILIGHSLGGLVAQMVAARTPLAALILLAPSPPWGVAGGTMEEAISAVSLYALGPFWALPIDPDYAAARRYLFDRLPRDERKATFARMGVESGRALWETLNWWLDPFATTLAPGAKVRIPVLGLAGALDAIHPPATVKAIVGRLGGDTRVLPGMSHWLAGEPGWENVAGLCFDWLGERALLTAA
ncbi:MAG: alpha/beta hydrolase [Caulobacteraceae bacterium]